MALLKACLVNDGDDAQDLVYIGDYKPSMKNKLACPQCNEDLVAKMGFKNTHHYAHKSKMECDSWYEPMTSWHRSWQDLFRPDNVEVIMACDGIKHIADVAFDGHILEIQHSHISASDVKARESFYMKIGKSLTWIVDGRSEKDCVVLGVTHDDYSVIWASRSWWWHAKCPVLIDTNEGLFRIFNYFDKKVGLVVQLKDLSHFDVSGGLSVTGGQKIRCMLSSRSSPRLLTTSYKEIMLFDKWDCVYYQDNFLSCCQITGDTYKYRDTIKKLGMIWNRDKWSISCQRNGESTKNELLWHEIAELLRDNRSMM